MTASRLIAVVAALSAVSLAGTVASAAGKKPAPEATEVSLRFPVYDSLIDVATLPIQELLAHAGEDGTFLEKRDSAGVAEYYAEQGYQPTFVIDGQFTAQAKKIMARLQQADADGLDQADFPMPVLTAGVSVPDAVAANAEVMLATAIVRYAREAHSGRLDPADISANFSYEPHLLDPATVLMDVSTAADPAAIIDGYNPKHIEFLRLRDKLADLRANQTERPPVVPEGKLLKLGVSDERVAILRARLGVVSATETPNLFDEDVDVAVKAFQEGAGLKAAGIVGQGTLGIMNAAADDHIATVLANMERWRWMPEDLGKFYVRVNIPNFDLDIYEDGHVIYNTRIVDGQVDKQTPVFSHEIEHVIVNPTWNVPESIATKEMLPKLMANPASMAGYQVFALIDGKFRAVDPVTVDWSTVNMKRIQIKQPPGERNALGSIKFMFPNPYSVYLHDTPSKSFFERDYRALSHGCMRVQDPWEFAAVLLKDDPNVTVSKLKKLVGGRETRVNLTSKIPVHITYFTAWVDENGDLQTRADIYGHDSRVEKGLGV